MVANGRKMGANPSEEKLGGRINMWGDGDLSFKPLTGSIKDEMGF